jgi:hypothetical protein
MESVGKERRSDHLPHKVPLVPETAPKRLTFPRLPGILAASSPQGGLPTEHTPTACNCHLKNG